MAKQKQQSPIEKKLSIPVATPAPILKTAPVAAAVPAPAKPVEIVAAKVEPPKKVEAPAAKVEAPKKTAKTTKTAAPAKTTKPAKTVKEPKAPKKKQLTYEEIVAKVSEQLKARDASKLDVSIAAQIVVTGEIDGIFYIEVKDGKIAVEPYDYKNNDFEIKIPSDILLKVAEGKMSITGAVLSGAASFTGDIKKAFALGTLF